MRSPAASASFSFLEPDKLGFQVANTLLQTAHFGDHTRVGTADVAE